MGDLTGIITGLRRTVRGVASDYNLKWIGMEEGKGRITYVEYIRMFRFADL
jgi:hypothetical protein